MTPPHWHAALRLQLTPGLGLRRCKLLVQALGSCQAVLEAPDDLLREVLDQRTWAALRAQPPEWASAIAAIDHWLGSAPTGLRHTVLAWGDPDYPLALHELHDPPLLLFVTDSLTSERPMSWPAGVALVGSRQATPQGLSIARQWAHQLADAGWCVVSGLAHGIDAAAHAGALQSGREGLLTMALMGTGPDLVYPPGHGPLKSRIAGKGRCITEHLPGVRARKMHFPWRNRLLVGLSAGVVVIEADLASGSLISAQCALDLGREVMAVPGSIRSTVSQGCHALLRQGATLVENVADVMAALPHLISPQSSASEGVNAQMGAAPLQSPPEADGVRRLRLALGLDPWTLDELHARIGGSWADLHTSLQQLEWQGHLARLPGDRVQWIE